jgi:hypothetical protein
LINCDIDSTRSRSGVDGDVARLGTPTAVGTSAALLDAAVVVAALRAGGFRPAGDVWLGFVTDEEYASIGTEALVKAVHADAAILTEPTEMGVCRASRLVWLMITTEGHAAHGSLYDVTSTPSRTWGASSAAGIERDVLSQRASLLGRPRFTPA